MARLGARLMAHDLAALGINVDCAPVLDVPAPGADDIIGDRAYGADPAQVAALGRAVAEGLIAGGVLPVIKHIPGHGRAQVDSHLGLPVVDASFAELEERDFAPFRALADLPMAMTAHVVYAAVDRERPATTSRAVIDEVIRGAIGFDGVLISDDLSMRALGGDFRDRAESALAAGCDMVLHCNGDMAEMQAVASGAAPLAGEAAARAARALAILERTRRAVRRRAGAAGLRRGPWRKVGGVNAHFQPRIDFEAAACAALDGEELIVDLDGYEGPLHVLLALARSQKVDSPEAVGDPAGRAVPGLRPRGPDPPLRPGGGLSGHGRLARLSEIAPAAAQTRAPCRGRAGRRGCRRPARLPAGQARRHEPGGRGPEVATAPHARRVHARRPAGYPDRLSQPP